MVKRIVLILAEFKKKKEGTQTHLLKRLNQDTNDKITLLLSVCKYPPNKYIFILLSMLFIICTRIKSEIELLLKPDILIGYISTKAK